MDPDQQPQDPAQNVPAAPAEPAAPVSPTEEPTNQPPASDEGNAPADPPADVQTPAADPAAQPAQSRQDRRNQEREQRIRELNNQVKQAGQPSYQPGQQQGQSPFPRYEEGQVVTPEQLERDMVQSADAIATARVSQQLAQNNAVNNFDRDTEVLPGKYAELNPDNDAFTPELDEAIAQEFQERAFKVVGYDNQGRPVTQLDPSVRLADIAQRQITAARAYAAKVSSGNQQRHDASADATAPRPSGGKPAEKDFKNMSLAEMKAKVGYHQR